MSTTGRNDRCRCGSGKKAKRCCGVRRGPSDPELAKAFLAVQGRQAARRLLRLPTAEVYDLFVEMLDLPARQLSAQLRLPRLWTPELDALRQAIDDDDDDAVDERVGPALSGIDTPQRRAELARAVLALADDDRIGSTIAAVALVDLDSRSQALMRSSLLAALSVSVGAARSPSGLLVVAR